MTRRIELHIEELVLHGFRASDRHRIAGALHGELTRLLEEGNAAGLAEAEHARLDAGMVNPGAKAGPAEVGRQVAASIYGKLTQ